MTAPATIRAELAGTSLLGVPLAPRELRALAALADRSESTPAHPTPGVLRQYRHGAYQKLGVHGPVAAYAVLGWLAVPSRWAPLVKRGERRVATGAAADVGCRCE